MSKPAEAKIHANSGSKAAEAEGNHDFRYEASAEQDRRMLYDDVLDDYPDEESIDTLLIADPPEDELNDLRDDQNWRTQNNKKREKERIQQTVEKELSSSEMMTSEEAERVVDVWKLSKKDRWRLYRYWVDQLCRGYRQTVERYQEEFEYEVERLQEAKSMEDLSILKKATVIGMTTTGAAKYRKLIQKIQPRITIVEEAAEVLETHIVTSLSPGCQHLILIGDHQQLRPNPTVFDLAKNYQLDMSLFERMFKNGMRLERLCAQHRMRPEIAEMMVHIYDNLQNHESVLDYEQVMGVSSNIFFIEHSELEEYIEEGRSRSNIHEAKYLAALCRYFILQGYKPNQITILTMYTGQLIQLKKQMPRDFFQAVRVCAVDNFQGEENDIILLSLVRSNEEGKIGFLRISNRVCVALSRAKKGFYCIGNIELMCEKEKLWKNIIEDMREKKKVGPHLTLTCQKHPKNIIQASKPEDFRAAPEGGCMEPCNARLDCGHVCEMLCHPIDSNHEEYKCRKRCTKKIECGIHRCPKWCWEECGDCMVLVSKTWDCGHVHTVECHVDPEKTKCRLPVLKEMPDCHHEQQVPCYMDPKEFHCQAPCLKTPPCSHPCPKLCSEKCDKYCRVKVEKTWRCGHKHTVECLVDPNKTGCLKSVSKEIPDCHHEQQVPCYKDPKDFRCRAPCSCSHPCTKLCSEKCDEKCMVLVDKTLSCGHVNNVECHILPKKKKCTTPCTELLKCQHYCQGNCGDCFQGRVHQPCQAKCNRPLFCGHHCKEACSMDCKCQKRCGAPCTPCTMPCSWVCKHYKCTQLCGEPCDRPRCDEPCRKKLRCGHPCIGMCGEPCPKKCRVCNKDEVTTFLFGDEDKPDARFVELQGCGHVIEVKAMDRYMDDVKTSESASDEASSVELKRCPWCKASIRSAVRYGNVIKSTLADFEQIKSKPMTSMRMDADVSSSEIQEKICKLRKRSMLFSYRFTIPDEVYDLEERITYSSRFSEQEKEEINEELLRVSLLTSYRLLVHQIDRKNIQLGHFEKNTLDHIGGALDSGKRIDKEDRERFNNQIQEITEHNKELDNVLFNDEEKSMTATGVSTVSALISRMQWVNWNK